MKSSFQRTRVASAIAGAVVALGAGNALGSAFALQEQNASGLGNAYAGGAAVAEDVSTIFFNPAGLSRIKGVQVVAAGNLICPSAKFSDNASKPAAFQALGGDGGDAGGCAAVPNLYVGIPINDQWSFGLGINAPFGLKTEYDSDWLGRFQAVKSSIETINVNPTVSWAPTKELSFGAGVNFQRFKAELTSRANYAGFFAQGVGGLVAGGTIPAAAAPTLIGSAAGLQSDVKVDGSDSSWGWNVGALWQASAQTRVGFAYRSSIKYEVDGNVNFNNPTATGPLPPTLAPVGALLIQGVNAQLANSGVKLSIKMPDTGNISIFHQLNSQWDLMADLQYTGWAKIQQLQIVRNSGTVLSTTPENFRNTWRGSIGANYRFDDKLTLRGGVAYDQSPINDTDRTPRLPDNNRTWLSFGAQYRFMPNLAVDAGYTHIFVSNSSISQNEGSTAANGLIDGTYKNSVDIVGLQLTYTMK